jgi:AcrR family transcriptional regulator
MPRTSDKRERLIRSADQLILRQGYKQTTLSDIAEDSGVPLGNVYYYFKTKEDIGKTIIDSRIKAMQTLLAQCSEHHDPKARLLELLGYPIKLRRELAGNGCPLGTLSYELSRLDSNLNDSARDLVNIVLDWSTQQFELMGQADYKQLGLQFVSNLQGMSLIANALDDPAVVDQMVERTRAWIASL